MRLSKADKLATAYQDKIVAWRLGGDTVDQIRGKLQEEDLPPDALPGRTGMSLYVRKLDQAMEYLLRYRVATATLGRSFDENAEAKEARLNIELLNDVVMERLFTVFEEGTEKLSAKEIHEFAQVIYRLTRAQRTDALTTLAVRKEARAQSERAAPAETTAPDGEMSAEQILRLKMKLAGLRYEDWMEGGAARGKQSEGAGKRCEGSSAPNRARVGSG